MNSRHGALPFATPRGLWLCLALLVFVGLAVSGFAQEAATADPYQWPYFGPDSSVEKFIYGAFVAQAGLLGAFSAGSGTTAAGMQTLQIIGLLAALVGGIFMAFNRGLWQPSVVAAWLLLVAIVIFVPTNSRLLFAPLVNVDISGNPLLTASNNASTSNVSHWGFAPQMAAVDVASRAQLIVSDMFRSRGWRDITGEMLANQRLLGNSALNAGPSWVKDLSEYSRQCEDTTLDKLYRPKTGQADTPLPNQLTSSNLKPVEFNTLGNKWGEIVTRYTQPDYHEDPPYIMGLVDETTTGLPLDFLPRFKADYEIAITKLYQEVTGLSENVTWEGKAGENDAPQSKSIKFTEAFDRMQAFFDPEQGDGNFVVGAGFILQPLRFIQNYDLENSVNSGTEKPKDTNVLTLRCGYENTTYAGANTKNCAPVKSSISSGADIFNVRAQRNAVLHSASIGLGDQSINQILADDGSYTTSNVFKYVNSKEELPASWRHFVNVMELLKKVPVVEKNFTGLVINKVSTPSGGPEVTAVAQVKTGYVCLIDGPLVINRGLLKTLGQAPKQAFAPFIALLTTPGTKIDAQLTPQQVATGASADPTVRPTLDPTWNGTAVYVTTVMNRVLRDMALAKPNLVDSGDRNDQDTNLANWEEATRMVMLQETLRMIHRVTLMQLDPQTAIEKGTTDDFSIIQVVGNDTLTSVGGGLANFFGTVLISVGAFFTGAFAQAYVGFLQLFVQLTIMGLIVLTPFLFIAGVLMPRAAPGVIIISIMAAFILQFVPVTMIILNYLGGLIYDIIVANNPRNSWTLQSMLIIGMAGLYTSIVGLTLYLMFKLGDPQALLGRLSELDGAAQKAADAGLKGVKLMAIAAATALSAGSLGAAFGAFGTKGAIAKGLVNRAGQAVTNAAAAVRRDGDSGAMPQTGAPETPTPGGGGATNDRLLLGEDALNNLRNAGFNVPPGGLTPDANGEFLAPFGPDGDQFGKFRRNANGSLEQFDPSKPGEGWRAYDPEFADGMLRGAKRWEDASSAAETPLLAAPEQPLALPAPSNANRSAAEFIGPQQPQPSGDTEEPEETEQSDMEAKMNRGKKSLDEQIDANNARREAGGFGPKTAGVAGGNAAAAPQANSTSAKVAATEIPATTSETRAEKPAEGSTEKPTVEAVVEVKVAEKVNPKIEGLEKKVEDKIKGLKTDLGTGDRNQQATIGARIKGIYETREAQIAEWGGVDKLNHEQLKFIKDKYDEELKALKQLDGTAREMGNLFTSTDELDKRLNLEAKRIGADVSPSWRKNALSGFIGGVKSVGGGVGSIPIVGNVLKGAFNEYYEAPERAKAWQAAGGFMKHWKAGGDAARMSFYQQEVSPLASAYQYQQMSEVGAFQSVVTGANFQVAQSVAKMRSDFEAMMSKAVGQAALGEGTFNLNSKDKLQVGALNVSAVDLQGLGRVSSFQNIGGVWAEAAREQGPSWKVSVLNTATNKMEDQYIKPSLTMMSRVYSDLANKQAGKAFDGAMTDWYGIVEKVNERDSADWRATRDMAHSKGAAAKFMAEDISTDYLVGGHLKMVQGKDGFYKYRGLYQGYLEARNEESATVMGHMLDKDSYARITRKMQKDGVNIDAFPADLTTTAMRTMAPALYGQLAKAAVKDLQNIDPSKLKLTSVFEESLQSGLYNIRERIAVSPYNTARLEDDLVGATLKAKSAYLESVQGISKTAQRQINFEVDGKRFSLDKATSRVNERALVFGDQADMFTQAMATVMKARGEAFTKSAIKTMTQDLKNKEGHIIGKEAFHEMSDEMRQALQKHFTEQKININLNEFFLEGNKFAYTKGYKDRAIGGDQQDDEK